jgi:hypothetical protein
MHWRTYQVEATAIKRERKIIFIELRDWRTFMVENKKTIKKMGNITKYNNYLCTLATKIDCLTKRNTLQQL